MIYTSGSTGKPEGVMVPHQGLNNIVEWKRKLYDIRPGDRISQLFSYSFDGSVADTFMALSNGATLMMLPSPHMEPAALIDYLNLHRINVFIFVPSMLKHLNPDDLYYPERLTVVSAGEACPKELAQRWMTRCRFVNGYGPTECSVGAIMGRIPEHEVFAGERVPISSVASYPITTYQPLM